MQIYSDDKISYALIISLLDIINESGQDIMEQSYLTGVTRDWKYNYGELSSISFSTLLHHYGHTFGRIIHTWL